MVVDESLAGAEAVPGRRDRARKPCSDVVLPTGRRRVSGHDRPSRRPSAGRPDHARLDLGCHDLDFDAQEGHDLFARR